MQEGPVVDMPHRPLGGHAHITDSRGRLLLSVLPLVSGQWATAAPNMHAIDGMESACRACTEQDRSCSAGGTLTHLHAGGEQEGRYAVYAGMR